MLSMLVYQLTCNPFSRDIDLNGFERTLMPLTVMEGQDEECTPFEGDLFSF
jgi:hypothetical protein